MRFSKPQSRADHDESDKSADLTAVGIWLKTEREKRNESLDSVSSITRIGRPYLEAIEEGDLSKLPGQAYIRGFIKLYAAHLGLSADDALQRLEHRELNQPVPAEDIPAAKSPDRPALAAPRPWLRYGVMAMTAISVAVYVLFFSTPDRKTAPPKNADSTVAAPAKEQVTAPPTGNNPAAPVAQPADKPSSEKAGNAPLQEGPVLRLKAVRDAKMHITIDSAVSQEYNLIAGDIVEWKADKSFQIDLDNAAAVEAELDGKQLPSFGDAGKAAHLVITRSGVQQN